MPTVLVVDDDPRNRRLMEAQLVPLGYRVLLAADGPEALAVARVERPDVALLAVMMPGMDGFELVRLLRAAPETSDLPVVMVTALSETTDRVRALEAGADDFLSKPVDPVELEARVRTLAQVKAYRDHLRRHREELEAEVERKASQLREALRRLQDASLDTIHRLARAAEYKDEHTGAHIQRMSRYAAAVARELGLGDERVEAVLYAASMHDVGKIGVPDQVLLKPGPLTDAEWAVMREHTEIGGRILQGSDAAFLRVGEAIALTHHERWDGAGYPGGLKEDEIPLEGRICALADVFDALGSKRPYKDPYPLDVCFRIVAEERGRQFDPEVVDAFFRVREEIEALRRAHPDGTESRYVTMVGRSSDRAALGDAFRPAHRHGGGAGGSSPAPA